MKYSLLVVDDELANLQKLKRTFLGDFEVFDAQSGEEALSLLKERRFTAIITDQRMPGITGVELLNCSLESSPEAVRIILTGYTEVEDLMEAINKGQVHRYVTKPWEPFSLKQTVIQDIEHRRLKRENHILSEQLRIAKEVQSNLFPQLLPKVPNLNYFGVCRQAREVGGDYYDFLQFEPEKLWFAVGDASGKGIGSALLMSSLQALLRSQAPVYGESLSELVQSLNRFLLERTQEDKFATLFLGIFDSTTRRLRYVNAGHSYPFLIHEEKEVEVLESTGTIIGMFSDAKFEQEERILGKDDLLAVYTDGLTDAVDSADKEFGEARLLKSIRQSSNLSLEKMAGAIFKYIRDHCGEIPPVDDMTLVLVRTVNSE
jgi:serine phosphatase RsbU (regulator of sigma subunit)